MSSVALKEDDESGGARPAPTLRPVSSRKTSVRCGLFATLVIMDAHHLPEVAEKGFTAQEIASWGWMLYPDASLFQSPGNRHLPSCKQTSAKLSEKVGNWMQKEGCVVYERAKGDTVSRARVTRLGRYHAKELEVIIPDGPTIVRLWDEAQARLSLGSRPKLTLSA